MTNKIKLPLDELRVGFESAIKQAGTALKGEIPMRLGNPETLALFANDEKTLVYVHTSGDEPGGLTTIPVSSIPKNKLLFAQPILVKPTPYGTLRYVGLDDSEDIIYGQGDIAQTDAMPVLVSQIRWGTIQPTGTLSLLITAAWYGSTYVPDIVTDEFDGTVEDTSSNPIISPTTNNRVIFVLIQINPTNQEVTFKQSIEYNASVGFESAFVNSLVPTIDSGNYKLGYARLVTGMISFGYGDIYNTPEWLTPTNQDVSANTLTLKDGSTLTLSANIDGAIAVTKARHLVDTNAAASTGDLKTVNGLSAGEVCIITAAHTDRTIVVKHNGGTFISCVTGADITIDDAVKAVALMGNPAGTGVNAYPLFSTGGNIGTGVSKTINGSDTVAAGTDRNLIISANSGTSDLLREITGLSVGESIYLRAAIGHTISVQHNHASATIKIHLQGDTSRALDEQIPLKLTLMDTNILSQDLAGNFGDVFGPGTTTTNALVRWSNVFGTNIKDSNAILTDNGALALDLDADVVGFGVSQHSTQTANPLEIRDSGLNLQHALAAHGGTIHNEEGNDVDFRVESDNDANALFVDGGNDNVGIGTGTPDASAKQDISSTTKGALLPRMTSSQRGSIASPADGLTVYDTDYDMYFARNSGASAYHAVGAYTRDGNPFKDPVAGVTWNNLNQASGTFTLDSANRRAHIVADGNGTVQIRGWYRSISVPYVATFHVTQLFPNAGNDGWAIFFRQNSTQELHTIAQRTASGGSVVEIASIKWTNETTVSAAYLIFGGAATQRVDFPIEWVRLRDDNTNRYIDISPDGIVWINVHTVGRTDFLTADEIGIGIQLSVNGNIDTAVSYLSMEIT